MNEEFVTEPMGKTEYLGKLSYYLRDLPYDQVSEAMEYYQAYLNDAGPGGEAEAINHLGSPEIVAERIRRDVGAAPISSMPGPESEVEAGGSSQNSTSNGASSFFDRHDVADRAPQKNVNPYSKKNYYEEHGIPRPERKAPEGTEAGSSQHKSAAVLGIAALILCFAWIPILIVLIILGFTFAAIPTVIIMLVGALVLFLKAKGS